MASASVLFFLRYRARPTPPTACLASSEGTSEEGRAQRFAIVSVVGRPRFLHGVDLGRDESGAILSSHGRHPLPMGAPPGEGRRRAPTGRNEVGEGQSAKRRGEGNPFGELRTESESVDDRSQPRRR